MQSEANRGSRTRRSSRRQVGTSVAFFVLGVVQLILAGAAEKVYELLARPQ